MVMKQRSDRVVSAANKVAKEAKKVKESKGEGKTPPLGSGMVKKTADVVMERHRRHCAAQGLTYNPKTKSCE